MLFYFMELQMTDIFLKGILCCSFQAGDTSASESQEVRSKKKIKVLGLIKTSCLLERPDGLITVLGSFHCVFLALAFPLLTQSMKKMVDFVFIAHWVYHDFIMHFRSLLKLYKTQAVKQLR